MKLTLSPPIGKVTRGRYDRADVYESEWRTGGSWWSVWQTQARGNMNPSVEKETERGVARAKLQ